MSILSAACVLRNQPPTWRCVWQSVPLQRGCSLRQTRLCLVKLACRAKSGMCHSLRNVSQRPRSWASKRPSDRHKKQVRRLTFCMACPTSVLRLINFWKRTKYTKMLLFDFVEVALLGGIGWMVYNQNGGGGLKVFNKNRKLILDSCALIDGRIVEIVRA